METVVMMQHQWWPDELCNSRENDLKHYSPSNIKGTASPNKDQLEMRETLDENLNKLTEVSDQSVTVSPTDTDVPRLQIL